MLLKANKSIYLELSLKSISTLFGVANLSRKVITKTIKPCLPADKGRLHYFH